MTYVGRRELILDLLRRSSEPVTIVAIADELGVHPNTVRFHLDPLVDAGRVERMRGESAGPGRPPVVYRASRSMDRNGRSNYRLLAAMLTRHLASTSRDPSATAAQLGRKWEPELLDHAPPRLAVTKTEALTRLNTVLDDLGFEPEVHKGGRSKEIRLRHCPFLELVDDHADVICALHLGLMQGALSRMNGPVTVDRLDPFVEPDLCVAHLAPAR